MTRGLLVVKLGRDGDPRTAGETQPIGVAGYATLDALIAGGAPVLHPEAAQLARRYAVPLTFVPFPFPGPTSRIVPSGRELAA